MAFATVPSLANHVSLEHSRPPSGIQNLYKPLRLLPAATRPPRLASFPQGSSNVELLWTIFNRVPPTEIMLDLYDKIQDACSYIRKQWNHSPHAGIILGTGLGPLVEKISVEAAIEYTDIPHFPKSTATSHRGRLVCGSLCGLPVMAMEGRFHMYEGYPLKQITLPVRVMNAMWASRSR